MKFKGHIPHRHESIWDEDKRLREEAKKLAELHKDKKATKFDLK
jgi:hypothetical protein